MKFGISSLICFVILMIHIQTHVQTNCLVTDNCSLNPKWKILDSRDFRLYKSIKILIPKQYFLTLNEQEEIKTKEIKTLYAGFARF